MTEKYITDGLINWKNEIDAEIKAIDEEEKRLNQGREILCAKLRVISYSKNLLNAGQRDAFVAEYEQPLENELDKLEKELASKRTQFLNKRTELSTILSCIEGYIQN